MTEQWRDVPGYEGHYQVSNHGRVKSLKFGKERIMVGGLNSRGYITVSLRLDGGVSTKTIHSLVAAAFLGKRPENADVNHMSGDKTDNRIQNLEYVSHYDNSHHAIETLNRLRGTDREIVKRIIHLLNTTAYSQTKIAELSQTSQRVVCHIMHGKTWAEYAHLITPEAKAKRSRPRNRRNPANRKEQAS